MKTPRVAILMLAGAGTVATLATAAGLAEIRLTPAEIAAMSKGGAGAGIGPTDTLYTAPGKQESTQ